MYVWTSECYGHSEFWSIYLHSGMQVPAQQGAIVRRCGSPTARYGIVTLATVAFMESHGAGQLITLDIGMCVLLATIDRVISLERAHAGH